MAGDDHRHGQRHRSGGTRDLCSGAAENGGEQAQGDSAVHAGHRAQTGGHPESQCGGQPYDRRGDAAESIITKAVQVVAHGGRP